MTTHIVALDSEVRPSSMVRSRLGVLDLVIWRGASGKVHVWQDLCPHRSTRLSCGRNMGDHVEDAYHGWRFGEDGSVVAIPAESGKAFPDIRARVLTSVVAGGFVWASAESTVTPDPAFSGHPSRPLHMSVPASEVSVRLGAAYHVTPWGADECMVYGLSDAPAQTHRVLLRMRRELEARS